MTPEVRTELALHRGGSEVTHTDFRHEACACARLVASRPPAQLGLPDGGVCFRCGGMTVRTGTCTACTTCGETGGCG